MDAKKILVFTIILIIAFSSLCIISAVEEINLLGIDFSIPDGYKEAPNGANMTNYVSCIYVNNLNQSNLIEISVHDKVEDLERYENSSNYEKTTIGGHEGYKSSNPNDKYIEFYYLTDGKTVMIKAVDENIIEMVMS